MSDLEARIYTKDPIYCDLTGKQVARAIELMDQEESHIGVFGWDNLQQALNIAFTNNEFVFMRDIISYAMPTQKSRKAERRKMTPKLRYEILSRDNFRCKACGKTAAETTLHVDHIVPVSRGGKTVVDNLQTLCMGCNLGKFTD